MAVNNRSWFKRQRRSCHAIHVLTACMTCWLLLMAPGCISHATKKKCPPHDANDCVICPTGLCGGYYPTCWRLWPADCPTCPVEPAIAPLVQPPIEPDGEFVLPPAPMAENQPGKNTDKNFGQVSHRRPRSVSSGQSDAPSRKPASSTNRLPARGPQQPPAPSAVRSVGRQPSGGNVINLLSATATSPSNLAGNRPGRGPSDSADYHRAGSGDRRDGAVVTWRFSSAGSHGRSEPPAASVASDAAPIGFRSDSESPLIESILSPSRPSPVKNAADSIVGPAATVGPALP